MVSPRHLATQTKVVDRLVGDGQSAVVVALFLHVPEFGREGDDAEEVPSIITHQSPNSQSVVGLNEPLLQVLQEAGNDLVHVWLHGQDGRHRVVAHHGMLQLCVFDIVALQEYVVLGLAVDDGAAILIEVGLDPLSVCRVNDTVL